jgi:putative transcriptional regulator
MRNRIRVLRAERDLSQAALADLVNVSRQSLNAIENDRHDPSVKLAFAIARALRAPITDVFMEDET